mmetsp:Transcript_36929/g.51521  ORF Transcript_36929/g.51521 Transcript_36929/m.51521 type:complete len:155 (-) Transcript_36929:112-576(-)
MGCCFSCCSEDTERDSSTSPQEEQPLIDDAGNNPNRSARSPTPYGRFVEAALLQHLRQVYTRSYADQVAEAEEAQMERIKRVTAIEGLPVTVCTSQLLSSLSNNAECTICMEEYDEGVELRFLPCMHMYHRHCIDDWLERSATCPECNASIIED